MDIVSIRYEVSSDEGEDKTGTFQKEIRTQNIQRPKNNKKMP
jgi:hypothetical protein